VQKIDPGAEAYQGKDNTHNTSVINAPGQAKTHYDHKAENKDPVEEWTTHHKLGFLLKNGVCQIWDAPVFSFHKKN
jgi:hypothetical protein